MALTLTGCFNDKPTPCAVCVPEIVTVVKIVEKPVVVKCDVPKPVCDKWTGKLDEQLYSAAKCITDLGIYINICNGEK